MSFKKHLKTYCIFLTKCFSPTDSVSAAAETDFTSLYICTYSVFIPVKHLLTYVCEKCYINKDYLLTKE